MCFLMQERFMSRSICQRYFNIDVEISDQNAYDAQNLDKHAVRSCDATCERVRRGLYSVTPIKMFDPVNKQNCPRVMMNSE